ncbi:putative transcriptional regulator [Carnobacterium sp. AT7]|uniref:helix-turn-helix domain-containing protein n=1 Tax=Carnobacterium TaxID=2747 RepID=UPI00015F08DD|nr:MULTISPECIES: helix-turn-helix transcriptional regulator [Carnobacterium]EDP68389.1 putative transcriptional regulator [Carnobacterium sp. AT7]
MELGERLKQSRTNKGFSQTNVADHLNISRQSISKWENGNSLPDLANLVKLSNYYEVSIDELLKENKQLKNKIEANELEIEDKSQKLNFIRGISQNDEGLVLLGLSFLSFLISPLGLLISPILMIRNKKTNTLYRLIYIACICCIAYNLFIGYGILSDIFGWGTTTVEYLG